MIDPEAKAAFAAEAKIYADAHKHQPNEIGVQARLTEPVLALQFAIMAEMEAARLRGSGLEFVFVGTTSSLATVMTMLFRSCGLGPSHPAVETHLRQYADDFREFIDLARDEETPGLIGHIPSVGSA